MRTASVLRDSGPPESEFPKKMRSIGREAIMRFLVYWPGTAIIMG